MGISAHYGAVLLMSIIMPSICQVRLVPVVHQTDNESDRFGLYCKQVIEEEANPRSCQALLCRGYTTSGVYNVYPYGTPHFYFPVFCDQTTDGGGWTVFQRRMDGSVDFYRNWANYKLGFGEVGGEHWLGNDKIHTMLGTVDAKFELRIDMEAVSNERTYASYNNFSISSEADGYRLTLGDFLGSKTAGDALQHPTNSASGMKFSTKDRDQDKYSSSCATAYKGGWWYSHCHGANLNGLYHNGDHKSYADGVNWSNWKGPHESLKSTEIKFRAKF